MDTAELTALGTVVKPEPKPVRYLVEHLYPNRHERRRMASLLRHEQKRARKARLARGG